MKRKILIALLISLSIGANNIFGQSKKYVSLELAGINGIVGISYENRFTSDSKFGYKVGIGYGLEYHNDINWYFSPVYTIYPMQKEAYNTFSIPVTLNYLIGKEKHFLEIGAGASLILTNSNFGHEYEKDALLLASAAYRYEFKNKPLMLKGGLTAVTAPLSRDNQTISILPFFSIGYRM